MEKLIEMLKEKAGLNQNDAVRVAEFIKAHGAEIPVWLGQDGAQKLFGEVSSFFGSLAGDKTAETPPVQTPPPPVQPKD